MRSSRVLAPLAVVAAAALMPVLSAAQDRGAAASRAVNLSALQPTLIQQAAKAACFASLGGSTAEADVGDIRWSMDQFARVQAGLREGSRSLGLVAEEDPRLLGALDGLDREAGKLTSVLNSAAASGNISDDLLGRVARHAEPAYEEAQRVARRIEKLHGQGSALPLSVTLKISLGARQRVMSQTMAKQACMIARGVEVEAHRAQLAETVSVFETTTAALLNGFDAFGLAAEADPEQRARLEEAGALWAEVKPIYMAVIDGAEPDADELRVISWQSRVLFTKFDQAVFGYEQGLSG